MSVRGTASVHCAVFTSAPSSPGAPACRWRASACGCCRCCASRADRRPSRPAGLAWPVAQRSAWLRRPERGGCSGIKFSRASAPADRYQSWLSFSILVEPAGDFSAGSGLKAKTPNSRNRSGRAGVDSGNHSRGRASASIVSVVVFDRSRTWLLENQNSHGAQPNSVARHPVDSHRKAGDKGDHVRITVRPAVRLDLPAGR